MLLDDYEIKMKKLLVKIFFFVFISSSAYSQSIITEVFLDQLENSNSSLVEHLGIDLLNKAIINQNEKTNDGGILRFQNGEFTEGNLAEIFQLGNENFASIKQTGENNTSSARQLGDNNFYDLELTGNDNTLNIIQFGNENSILQKLSGDELNYILTQSGSNNEFIQMETGLVGKQMIITQTGGMRLVIR